MNTALHQTDWRDLESELNALRECLQRMSMCYAFDTSAAANLLRTRISVLETKLTLREIYTSNPIVASCLQLERQGLTYQECLEKALVQLSAERERLLTEWVRSANLRPTIVPVSSPQEPISLCQHGKVSGTCLYFDCLVP